jgi:hypothetical protein
MGDMADIFNDMKERRRKRRAELGVNCPRCNQVQPKRIPSILLPGQRCKVDGYVDPRPRERFRKPPMCTGCGVHRADPPSELCVGCEAYKEHQQ